MRPRECATRCCRTFSLLDYLVDPAFWANIINIGASAGYVAADVLSVTDYDISDVEWTAAYLTLAVLFVIDALLYMAAWYQTSDRSLDFWAYGEVFNIIGSVIFVISACIPAAFPNPKVAQMIVVRAALAMTNILGMTTFCFDALFYMTAWFHFSDKSESVSTKLQTADSWGEILNVTPSFLYLFASISFLYMLLGSSIHDHYTADDIPDLQKRTQDLFRAYAAADFIFTIDALFYAYAYFREKVVELGGDTKGENDGASVSKETRGQMELQYLKAPSEGPANPLSSASPLHSPGTTPSQDMNVENGILQQAGITQQLRPQFMPSSAMTAGSNQRALAMDPEQTTQRTKQMLRLRVANANPQENLQESSEHEEADEA